MKNTISIPEMLKIMESGETFAMTVCSYDKKRKRGGKMKEYHEAVLFRKEQTLKDSEDLKARNLTEIEKLKLDKFSQNRKNPHHYLNYSRNINILQDGVSTSLIQTIHIPLVVEFNGMEVIP